MTGKAAERIQDRSTINLDTARRIAEICEALVSARAEKKRLQTDKDGNPIYAVQINGEAPQQQSWFSTLSAITFISTGWMGQAYTNIVAAEMKARTAMMTHATSQPTNSIFTSESEAFRSLSMDR